MTLIISRTPLRLSLLGGGSDFPQWYARNDGAVLSATIDKYIYVTARFMPEFYPNGYKVIWKHIEQVSSIGEILHPTVRHALKAMGYQGQRGVEITYHGDLPANSGMGTSSAFAVGLLNALAVLRGDKPWDEAMLAASAIYLEQKAMGDAVGSQDQIAAAHGGVSLIRFPAGAAEFPIERLSGPGVEALQERLMLFYTGQTRIGVELQKGLIAGLGEHKRGLKKLADLALQGAAALRGGDKTDYFGEMLHVAWMEKRQLASGISNNAIDEIYRKARASGAVGGKLLGAGGSGFMVFYVPPEWQDGVKDALRDLIHVPFRFEGRGSQIILNGDAT